MYNEEKRFVKWTVILIIAIALAVIASILVIVYSDGKERINNTKKQTVAVDGYGNAVKDGQAMPMNMSFVRASAVNDVASVSITASITPADAMYSNPTWTVAWKDGSVTKTVTEYVTVTPNDLTATITCNKVFTDKIELKFTVKDYYDKEHEKTCELNYLDRIIGIESFKARYLPGSDYSMTRSPLPYNTYLNTEPCELDAFYNGSSSSVRYELGQINLKHSGGTVRAEEQTISFSALRIQYGVSYNGGWVSKVKEFDSIDKSPYLDFCEVIESLDNKTAILNASSNRPLVRVRFTFTNWTGNNNSFYIDCKLDYNVGIGRVSLSSSDHTFGR